MSADNGGPAFPARIEWGTEGGVGFLGESCGAPGTKTFYSGATLRDYFAARALPAIISAYVDANGRCIGTDHFPANCAAHAYRMADAMLMERDK